MQVNIIAFMLMRQPAESVKRINLERAQSMQIICPLEKACSVLDRLYVCTSSTFAKKLSIHCIHCCFELTADKPLLLMRQGSCQDSK